MEIGKNVTMVTSHPLLDKLVWLLSKRVLIVQLTLFYLKKKKKDLRKFADVVLRVTLDGIDLLLLKLIDQRILKSIIIHLMMITIVSWVLIKAHLVDLQLIVKLVMEWVVIAEGINKIELNILILPWSLLTNQLKRKRTILLGLLVLNQKLWRLWTSMIHWVRAVDLLTLIIDQLMRLKAWVMDSKITSLYPTQLRTLPL